MADTCARPARSASSQSRAASSRVSMLTPYSLMAARSCVRLEENADFTRRIKSFSASSTRRATLRCSLASSSKRVGSTVKASVKSAAISSMASSVVRLTPLAAYRVLYRSTRALLLPSRSDSAFTA